MVFEQHVEFLFVSALAVLDEVHMWFLHDLWPRHLLLDSLVSSELIKSLNHFIGVFHLGIVVGPNNTWCHILLHPQEFRAFFSLPYISVNFVDRDRIDRVHSDCIRTRRHDRQGAIWNC